MHNAGSLRLGKGSRVTVGGVTYIGGEDGSVVRIESGRLTIGGVTYSGGDVGTYMSVKEPTKTKLSGDILQDLCSSSSGSTQVGLLEDWLATDPTLTQTMMVQIICKIRSDVYKKEAVEKLCGYATELQVDAGFAMLQSIGSDVYKKEAVEFMSRLFPNMSVQQARKLCSLFKADTYIVDAIGALSDKILITSGMFAVLCGAVRADTYKVDVLRKFRHGQIDGKELCDIFCNIRSDTYKVDAAKTLCAMLESDVLMAITYIQSDTYKVDFIKAVKSRLMMHLAPTDVRRWLSGISRSYLMDAIEPLLSKMQEPGIEELLELTTDATTKSKLLQKITRFFPKNTMLTTMLREAKTEEDKQRAEAGFSIVINGFKLDVGHWPIGVDISVGLGSSETRVIRTDENSIEIYGQNARIQQVPYSGIKNLNIYGGSYEGGGVIEGNLTIVTCGNQSGWASETKAPPVRVHPIPKCQPEEAPSAPEKTTFMGGIMKMFTMAASGSEVKSGALKRQCSTAMSTELSCVICLDSKAVGVFTPCGHQCACIECGSKVQICPICRGQGEFLHISHVSASQRIYF